MNCFKENLAEIVGLSEVRLMMYLDRAEFTHIQRLRLGNRHKLVLANISESDIKKLIALKKSNRTKKRGYTDELCR